MSELDVMALLKKMQEQIISLERKVDTLVNKSQERPFNQERSFSKPFHPYGSGPRHNKGRNDHAPRKEFGPKKEFSQGRPFEKRSGSDNRGFSPKKKQFFNQGGTSHH